MIEATHPGDLLAEALLARVSASGLKLTPQRIAIVRELVAEPTHPTAQELYERLRARGAGRSMPGMSFATVYNTLDALTAAGLCSVRALAKGPTRFDPNTIPHHHTVCDQCGKVRDLGGAPEEFLPRPKPSAGDSPPDGVATALDGFSVRSVERVYRGLCSECASGEP